MSFQDRILNLEPVNLFDYLDEIPEFDSLLNTKQDKKWHAEGDVLTHTNMVLEKALPLAQKVARDSDNIHNGISIYVGALLHDFGKPYTTFDKNGRIVAYGHEGVGVSYARDFLRKYFPMFGFARREWLLSLVEFHGHPKRLIKGNSSDLKFQKLSLDVNTEQVYNVEIADFTGRVGESADSALANLETFKEKCLALGIWDEKYTIPGTEYMSNHVYKNFLWRVLFNHMRVDDKKGIINLLKLMGREPFELRILSGPPASGKTTYRKTLFPHIETISMDDERAKLLGNPNDMSKNQEIFDKCFGRLCSSIRSRQNVIWDATSATRKIRKRLIDVARRHGALVSIVVFDIPIDELKRRNADREKKVPGDIVDKFYRQYQTPKPYEYDKLIVVNEEVGKRFMEGS